MTDEAKLLIQEYAKNPINNHKMDDCTISQHEGNFICGDDITVYLKINNSIITKYSFNGNCSTITMAAASFLSELIINQDINTIMERNYETLKEQGFEVSRRRKNAAIISLLAAQNAILKYSNSEKQLDFDDLT